MKIKYSKYHALKNDFLVFENLTFTKPRLSKLALEICNRRTGIGADGIIAISQSKKADKKIDIYNADGGWAEKSGNGLRIAAMHLHLKNRKKKSFAFETGAGVERVDIVKKQGAGFLIKAELGKPDFDTENVPVKSKQKFMINSPIEVSGHEFPVTCLSVGNPHAVMMVDDFDLEWELLGEEIENHKIFPNRTNVEFVKFINRKKIKVADWERGAGATGSSGTGAAAAVCACVMLGITDRSCEVVFSNGSLFVDYSEDSNIIELTGPVEMVTSGIYDFK